MVTHKESTHIGRCIYCGVTDRKLTEEHASPYGLNGMITLLQASCEDCSKITSHVERQVLRDIWGAARAWMGYRSRHRSPETYAQRVMRNGVEETIYNPIADVLKIIELPIFKAPSELLGQGRVDPLECVSVDRIVLEEPIEDLAFRLADQFRAMRKAGCPASVCRRTRAMIRRLVEGSPHSHLPLGLEDTKAPLLFPLRGGFFAAVQEGLAGGGGFFAA